MMPKALFYIKIHGKLQQTDFENLLAASFIAYYAGAEFDRDAINKELLANKGFVKKYSKKLAASRTLYNHLKVLPIINSCLVDYEFMKEENNNIKNKKLEKA